MPNAFLIFTSEQSQFVNFLHPENILPVLALPALNEDKSSDVKELQLLNMNHILVTFCVLNEDTLIDNKEEQFWNIDSIVVTF